MEKVQTANDSGPFSLLDFVPLGLFVLRRDYTVLFWNECLESWTGITPKDICGLDIRDKYPRLALPRYTSRIAPIFDGGPPAIFSAQLHQYVIPAPLPDGKVRIQHTTVTPVKAPDGQSYCALFCIQDVTEVHLRIQDYARMRDQALGELKERRATQDALRESEEKYRRLFSKERDAIILLDMEDQRFLEANDAATQLFGYSKEEFLNKTLADISIDSSTVSEMIRRCALDETALAPTTWHIKKDGTRFPMEISAGSFIWKGRQLICAIMRDATERKRMEEALLRAKKLEATGILAGGIAHDFNNLLMIVQGNIEIATLRMEQTAPAHGLLKEALKAVHQAGELSKRFITVATGGILAKRTIRVKALVVDSATLALAGSRVECHFDLPEDLWPVEADEQQMRLVIHNVVLNAAEAVPEGGRVQISAENRVVAHTSHKPGQTMKEGDYVIIAIKDEGQGIPGEILEQIFDPYFSTKARGSQKGMGLGLTLVQAIISKHDGTIQVTSRKGLGTTVEIYLPASSNRPGAGRNHSNLPANSEGHEHSRY